MNRNKNISPTVIGFFHYTWPFPIVVKIIRLQIFYNFYTCCNKIFFYEVSHIFCNITFTQPIPTCARIRIAIKRMAGVQEYFHCFSSPF